MKNFDELLKELTVDEKIKLVEGYESWNTNSIPRLNIPSIYLTDGPLGLRKKKEDDRDGALGLGNSYESTAFIAPCNVANSFNKEIAYKIGEAIGKECNFYDVDLLLAPGMNIKRNPRCGRNFEYYSEDPYLSGIMASNFVNGLKSKKVGACLKHYALNNSENYRYTSNSICDIRTLRETYLKGFEIAIKNSDPDAIMCGYNVVNDEQCSENNFLNNVMLRDTFNFKGLVMTDWGATKNRVKGIQCGIDLDMPGQIKYNSKLLKKAIENNTLHINDLNKAVINVLKLVSKHQDKNIEKEDIDVLLKKHYELAVKCVEESAVLLKNDENILPLNKSKKVLVIGDLFSKMRYQGAGSSLIKPRYVTSPKDAFDRNEIEYVFKRGYNEIEDKIDAKLENEAINEAKNHDLILFFGGLTDLKESEGFDRENLNISTNQISLIKKLVKLNKKIVLVLFGGSSVIIPEIDKLNAILNMYVPGEGGGEACFNLLYGNENPSGRLCETWVKEEKDIPFNNVFGKTDEEIYKESIFVGYKYFEFNKNKILYPFGYGLSYSNFIYNDLKLVEFDDHIEVNFKIRNDSQIKGKEVAQIYIKNNANSKDFKVKKYLVDFIKVELKPHEEKEIKVNINKEEFKYFNVKLNRFVLESGTYGVVVGKDSFNETLIKNIDLTGEEVEPSYCEEIEKIYQNLTDFDISNEKYELLLGKKINHKVKTKHIDIETPLCDYNVKFLGKLVYKIVNKITINSVLPKDVRTIKKINKIKDEKIRSTLIKNRFFLIEATKHNSMRSLVQSSGGMFDINVSYAVVELANGHFIKAIKYLKNKN